MAIMVLNYDIRENRSGRKNIVSLVSCEHSKHEGSRERIVIKNTMLRNPNSYKICHKCAHKYKICTEETRKKLSEALSGAKNPFYKKSHSKEAIEKNRKAHLGKKQSEETILKRSLAQTGPLNWRWRHDLSNEERKEHKDRCYSPDNCDWRKRVYERDNWTCQLSGIKGNHDIVAHHLFNWATHEDLRYDVNNGVTMLAYLHVLFHHTYGNKNNTPEQFSQFKASIMQSYC